MIAPFEDCRLVPPQARTLGLEAGKSTLFRAVGDAVARSIVASGYGDGDAEGCSLLRYLVEGGEQLRGPTGLRAAPADRDHGWIVGGVVDGGRKARLENPCEVFIGEVDDYVGAGGRRCQRSRYRAGPRRRRCRAWWGLLVPPSTETVVTVGGARFKDSK